MQLPDTRIELSTRSGDLVMITRWHKGRLKDAYTSAHNDLLDNLAAWPDYPVVLLPLARYLYSSLSDARRNVVVL